MLIVCFFFRYTVDDPEYAQRANNELKPMIVDPFYAPRPYQPRYNNRGRGAGVYNNRRERDNFNNRRERDDYRR